MEHLIGETDAMEMVERLNAEFDIVVDQNDKLRQQNEILKGKLKVSESKKDKINEYYCDINGPPNCSQCCELIYYGQSYSEFKKEWPPDPNTGTRIFEIELYCIDCTGDTANIENDWTCKIIEEYD
tara:strand:+ start:37 stop:414 length:378 start_codon:yes stop_codon:yes gene_type:complete